MGFFNSLFENKDKKLLRELIEYNAQIIEKEEGRSRIDAEYLAICTCLEDLATRNNGKQGHKIVMEMLKNEYSQHYQDVMEYLEIQSGKTVDISIKEKVNKRQEIDSRVAELYESAINDLKERWMEYNELLSFKENVPLSDKIFMYSKMAITPFKKKYPSLNYGTLFLNLMFLAIIDSRTHTRMQIESARENALAQVLESRILN